MNSHAERGDGSTNIAEAAGQRPFRLVRHPRIAQTARLLPTRPEIQAAPESKWSKLVTKVGELFSTELPNGIAFSDTGNVIFAANTRHENEKMAETTSMLELTPKTEERIARRAESVSLSEFPLLKSREALIFVRRTVVRLQSISEQLGSEPSGVYGIDNIPIPEYVKRHHPVHAKGQIERGSAVVIAPLGQSSRGQLHYDSRVLPSSEVNTPSAITEALTSYFDTTQVRVDHNQRGGKKTKPQKISPEMAGRLRYTRYQFIDTSPFESLFVIKPSPNGKPIFIYVGRKPVDQIWDEHQMKSMKLPEKPVQTIMPILPNYRSPWF